MRIKLPILTEALEQAGTEQELAIRASCEVCAMVDGYRREMTRMFEHFEQRLNRHINDVVGQALSRIDEHIIHIGNVQMEQHRQIQGMMNGMSFLNQRQDRMEGRQDRMEARQDRMEVDIKDLKQGQARIEKKVEYMDSKLDEILKRV
ncbi:hypothetical protein [Endozoicomonas sp. 2B-B]